MPYRHVLLYGALVWLSGSALACTADEAPPRTPRPATSPASSGTRPATHAATRPAWPAQEPVLSYWRDANYLLNAPAVPLFAVWEDGTVLVRFAGRPYRGRLAPTEVAALLQVARDAGLFDPPIKGPVARPDGPSMTLAARDNGRRTRVSYDGLYDGPGALDQIGPGGSPSREQAVAFEQMWRRVSRATYDVAPERLERAEEPSLKHPARGAR